MPSTDTRPDPDALLAVTRRTGRGRLKIFLGAAPGVGKTFAMLGAAREQKASGVDVVIGIVETHGRAETEAMTAGFATVARRAVPYRNRLVPEFDLDAALARRPALLLVDELAHTNVPGSRHPKRWQDVEELLGAGIDVWTTMNVQHLESLNEVVLKITKVRVRETVPDTVFEAADEVVLVDLPPEELLKRLAEGKVYVHETATQAVHSFFKAQNLTALRELALRRTAEAVDADLVERMQAGAIDGPWAAGERILALVGADRQSTAVVRAAKRLADLMAAPWIAVTVERPGTAPDEAERREIDEALRLAESLGATTEGLVGDDYAEAVLRHARRENVTQLVVGRGRRGIFGPLFERSLAFDLVGRAAGIGVHVVTGDAETAPPARAGFRLPRSGASVLPYATSFGFVAAAALVADRLQHLAALPNLSMVFLTAVLGAAVLHGTLPAVVTSVLSFLTYNFFFVEPRYSFSIADGHDVLALAIFLVVGLATSALAGRVRDQARAAGERTLSAKRLFEFTRKLSGAATIEAVAEVAATEVRASLGRATVVYVVDGADMRLAAMWPPVDDLDTASLTAARWARDHDEPAGADTGTLPNVPWFFLPLRTSSGVVGVIGVAEAGDGVHIDREVRALLDTLTEQTAAAIERAGLAREIGAVKARAETEHVRNTLLASISHDFRTPLASILGAATSLTDLGERMSAAARADLLGQVREEAEHLDRMVRDLLAITRLEAGGLELRRDWLDLGETAARVVQTARRRFPGRDIALAADQVPLVMADATLIEQALTNIVENALTHGGAAARVDVTVSAATDTVRITVSDDGPGISAEVLPRIFEKFATSSGEDRTGSQGGTGLGLAIARGVVDAHGGTISAESPAAAGRGARFVVALPCATPDGRAA